MDFPVNCTYWMMEICSREDGEVSVGVSVENYEDRLCTWDGVHLRYRTWLPHESRGVAVLVHGAGEHLGLYEHLGERFIRDGFGLVLYDLRGFGCSEGRCGHITHFHEYLNDLDQLVHVFRKKLGNRRIYLIGHSLGGLIVARYVQHRPDHVDGIVLSAPALGLRIHVPISVKRLISIISRVAPSFSVNPYGLIKKAQRIPRLKSFVTYNVQTKLVDPLIPSNIPSVGFSSCLSKLKKRCKTWPESPFPPCVSVVKMIP